MRPATVKQLLDLNRQFYQTFAVQFSQTRGRLQPGVRRILERIIAARPDEASILDIGCGNGELAGELVRASQRGWYMGVDSSAQMLEEARKRQVETPGDLRTAFLQADLAVPGWEVALRGEPGLPLSYDFVLAFAVLHHLPGVELRRQVIEGVGKLLAPGGRFVHSNWQFLNSPRLAGRILPWETVGLSSVDVDPGDYLLDWKSGGYGLRYAHHFSEDELAALAEATGFTVEESFYSDGEGGRLGMYQVWKQART